jgi:beta-phosphoglucomutase
MIDLKKEWSRFKAIIFDMDGVLIDSYEMHKKAWNTISKEIGFQLNDKEFKKIFGLTSYEGVRAVKDLKNMNEDELNNFVDRVDRKFRELFRNEVQIINGSIDFVKLLKQKRYPIAIATSAPRENVKSFLGEVRIWNLFNVVVSGDDVHKGKPDPEIYLRTASLLNTDPKECLVFEDSLMGIESAKKAGMTCVAISSTHEKSELKNADFVIDEFTNIWETIYK